ETAKVSAKVGSVEPPNKTIRFYRAYPTSISVQPDKFSITQSFTSESTITATIKRSFGTPSIGQLVSFVVVNATNDTIVNTINRFGKFRDLKDKSNENGIASVVFT